MIKKKCLIPLLSLVSLFLLLFLSIFSCIYIQPVKATNPYKLHVDGTQLKDANNDTVYLRTAQISWNERRKKQNTTWGANSPSEAWFTESDVQNIKSYNGNCFELNGIPFKYIMKYKNVFNTEYFVDWCDIWVNWATTNEMYIIIDTMNFRYDSTWTIPSWIWNTAGYDEPTTKAEWDAIIRDFFDTDISAMNSNREAFINAWKGIANRYKDNDYVLFSVVNEPMWSVSFPSDSVKAHLGETYSEFMENVIDGIHSTGAENIIIINYSFVGLTHTEPINKTGFMWETHLYMGFSNDFDGWTGYVDAYISKFAGSYGKPLFFGEYGYSPYNYGKVYLPSTWLGNLTAQVEYLDNKTLVGIAFWEHGYLQGEYYDYVYDIYTESESEDILEVIFDFMGGEEEEEGEEQPPQVELELVSLLVNYPIQRIYPTSTIPVEIWAGGGTIDRIWYNCKNGSNWIYGNNLTYISPTTMTGFVDGSSYTFYGWANNTNASLTQKTVPFTVSLSFFNSSTLFDYNLALMGSWFPYLLNSTGSITSLLFQNLQLIFSVFSEAETSLTLVDATTYGEPIFVDGASSSEYYEEYQTIAINTSHSSEEEILIIWEHSYGEGASSKAPSNALVYGSDFGLQFYEGDSLALCGQNPLIFEVKSGLWNGSSGAVTVYADRGRFSFYAENNTVLEVSCPDAPSGLDLSVSGASYTQPSKFVWLVTVTSNNTVSFVWNWRLPSWLDLYFMFGVGMAGLIMMVFAPSWVAMGVRRNAFQVDKMERIGYAVLIFCVGFGLFCSWLWS